MSKNYFTEYYLRNRGHLLDQIKRNHKEKYRKDILFNLKQRLQARLDNEIGGVDIEDVLGCSFRFFKKYIKFSLKKKNLFFDDDFDIEHIKPINSHENKIKGFHWTNVQVLLSDENFKKGVERDYDLEEKHKNLVMDFFNYSLNALIPNYKRNL